MTLKKSPTSDYSKLVPQPWPGAYGGTGILIHRNHTFSWRLISKPPRCTAITSPRPRPATPAVELPLEAHFRVACSFSSFFPGGGGFRSQVSANARTDMDARTSELCGRLEGQELRHGRVRLRDRRQRLPPLTPATSSRPPATLWRALSAPRPA